MASANTTPVKMYLDTETNTVANAMWFIKYKKIRPANNVSRFIYLDSYQCRQNFPYLSDGQVVRRLYGKERVILSTEQIEKHKKMQNLAKTDIHFRGYSQEFAGLAELLESGSMDSISLGITLSQHYTQEVASVYGANWSIWDFRKIAQIKNEIKRK